MQISNLKRLLDIELREAERNADEKKMYKLILKRFGDGNLTVKARDKIETHISGSDKCSDF